MTGYLRIASEKRPKRTASWLPTSAARSRLLSARSRSSLLLRSGPCLTAAPYVTARSAATRCLAVLASGPVVRMISRRYVAHPHLLAPFRRSSFLVSPRAIISFACFFFVSVPPESSCNLCLSSSHVLSRPSSILSLVPSLPITPLPWLASRTLDMIPRIPRILKTTIPQIFRTCLIPLMTFRPLLIPRTTTTHAKSRKLTALNRKRASTPVPPSVS